MQSKHRWHTDVTNVNITDLDQSAHKRVRSVFIFWLNSCCNAQTSWEVCKHWTACIYQELIWACVMYNIVISLVWFFHHHWGVQLILAYSWARPAILVVGKGRGGMFLFLLFLHFHSCSSFFPVPLSSLSLFLPCPSLSSPLLSLLSLFSLSLGDDTKWPSRVDVSLNPNTINNKQLVFSYPPLRHLLAHFI